VRRRRRPSPVAPLVYTNSWKGDTVEGWTRRRVRPHPPGGASTVGAKARRRALSKHLQPDTNNPDGPSGHGPGARWRVPLAGRGGSGAAGGHAALDPSPGPLRMVRVTAPSPGPPPEARVLGGSSESPATYPEPRGPEPELPGRTGRRAGPWAASRRLSSACVLPASSVGGGAGHWHHDATSGGRPAKSFMKERISISSCSTAEAFKLLTIGLFSTCGRSGQVRFISRPRSL
jgi:hypothetical protein